MGKKKKHRNKYKPLLGLGGTQAAPAAEDWPLVLLEENKRLSDCLIWQLLEQYYDSSGISAWQQIPSYPTSNAFIGEAYAEMIVSFLLDYQAHLNWEEPLYIVEMATGTGCFSFYLLKELMAKRNYFERLKTLPICYVMTDFTENNVQFWESNPTLQSFCEAGVLDFAVFCPETDTALHLRRSQRVVSSETIANPVIAIANYFFDSIREDLFRIDNGQLQEIRLTLHRMMAPGVENTPLILPQVQIEETYVPLTGDAYPDPTLNVILQDYLALFENASILFPIGTFRCLQNLRTISRDNLVLLSSDRGFTHNSYMTGHWPQEFETYADGQAFSYVVNYNAIGRYFEKLGGRMFYTTDMTLCTCNVMAVLTPHQDCTLEQTAYYYEEVIHKRNPINYLYFTHDLLKHKSQTSAKNRLYGYMGFMRLCNYDPMVLCLCGEDLLLLLDEDIEWWEKEALYQILDLLRQNIYPVGWGRMALNMLGLVFTKLGKFEDCLAVLEQSTALYGADVEELTMMAGCYEAMGNDGAALRCYQQAAALCGQPAHFKHIIQRLETRLFQQTQS